MPFRNAPFEVEQIEKLALIALLPPHHGPPPVQKRLGISGITVRRSSQAPFSTASTHLCHSTIGFAVLHKTAFQCARV
jgi:hypothetical protein